MGPLLVVLLRALIFSCVFQFSVPGFPLCLVYNGALFGFFGRDAGVNVNDILNGTSLVGGMCIPGFVFPVDHIISDFIGLLFDLTTVLLIVLVAHSPFC